MDFPLIDDLTEKNDASSKWCYLLGIYISILYIVLLFALNLSEPIFIVFISINYPNHI
jgi:hypothetical protein